MNSRPPNANMNAYPARQTPRLQNTQKPPPGGGWGGGLTPGAAPLQNPFGGLGAPPRPTQLSGFAQVMGGGGAQGPIDMSDFPSLSGGPRPPQNAGAPAAGWNSSAIRQPPTQPQQAQPQSQQRAPSAAPSQQSTDQFDVQRTAPQPSAERSGGGEDFPPLGGQLNGEISAGQTNGFANGIGMSDGQTRQVSGQSTNLPIRQGSAYQANAQSGAVQSSPLSQQQQQPPPRNGQPLLAAISVKPYADMTENEKWGMPGLMAAREARRQVELDGAVDETVPPAMRSAIIMGQDLNDLGLNLDSQDPLYPTFTPFPLISNGGSIYDFHDRHVVPDFVLPSAYTVTNVPPLSSRIGAFSDETLFSIFYQSPGDLSQELAAQELTQREWRWHKIVRQWLQKDTRESNASSSLPLVDMATNAPIGAQPVRVADRSERGVYIFFDPLNWRRERREFVLDYEQLEHLAAPATANAGTAPGLANGPGMGMQNGNAIQSPQQTPQLGSA